MDISYVWDVDFPKGYGHTSIAYLKKCAGYEQAKSGDFDAAKRVVRQCIKRNRIAMIRRLYPNAVLLPVISNNKLPLALATEIGLPICSEVKNTSKYQRKYMCAMERLLYKPDFQGGVPPGIEFIIVDDIVTQGSTITQLRKHILAHGSIVVAIVALAYSIGSTIIAPKKDNVANIENKFGNSIWFALKVNHIANNFFELTNSQLRYLLRFKTCENIVLKMEATKAHYQLLVNSISIKPHTGDFIVDISTLKNFSLIWR